MTRSRSSVLDVVRPAHLTHPPSQSNAGQEVVELAASAGLHLDPWQQEVLRVALGEGADGRWSALQVGLICPRQNGKGSILEALELAWLFLFEDKEIIHSAHEFATSGKHFRRLVGLIENTPDLMRRVKRNGIHRANGKEAIELVDGTVLAFKTRTKTGNRGLTGDKVVLDEAMVLSSDAISSILPVVSARENPQLWVTASAPLITDESIALRRFCHAGRAGDEDLAYIEFCAEDDADLDDRDAWQAANPSYPHRLQERSIRAERSGAMRMDDDDFARERLGIWHDPADDTNQVIPSEQWHETETDDSQLDGAVVFGLEVADNRNWSAFGAVGRSSLGDFVHGEVVDYREGTAWVPARAKQLVDKWGAKIAVPSGSPAASLVKDMQKAGLQLSSPPQDSDDIVVLAVAEHAKACGQLHDSVVNLTFRHRVQPHLTVAVRGAVKRDLGDGTWTFSRRRSSVDVSPLNAVTVAMAIYDPVSSEPEFFVY